MTRRTEGWLLQGRDRGAWLGSLAGEAGPDLADDLALSDLVEDAGPDRELLRASRIPRMRPVLVVLAARAAGASEVDHELQYASELLAAALTVHDVALGSSGGRRRRLARRVLSASVGWLGGNQMLLRAMELARHAPSPLVLDAALDTVRAFSESQALAQELVAEGAPTVELWSEHADGHTGALFAFCCRAGGLVAGAKGAEVAALGRYGRHLGRLWHVAEDVCLLQGDDAEEELLGRALSGRPILAVAVAAARDPRVAHAWRAVVDDPEPARAAELLRLVHAVKGIQGTREFVVRELWDARQAVLRLPPTSHRRALERLASGLSKAPYEEAEGVAVR